MDLAGCLFIFFCIIFKLFSSTIYFSSLDNLSANFTSVSWIYELEKLCEKIKWVGEGNWNILISALGLDSEANLVSIAGLVSVTESQRILTVLSLRIRAVRLVDSTLLSKLRFWMFFCDCSRGYSLLIILLSSLQSL